MKQCLIFTCAAVFIFSTEGLAGYKDLKKAFDGHQPPALARIKMTPAEPVHGAAARDRSDRKIGRMFDAARARWEKALSGQTGRPSFYRLPADLRAALAPAADDAAKAADALRNPFGLETLEALASLRNPTIASAALKFRAALQTFGQVQALDEILAAYSAFTETLMTGIGPIRGKDPIAMTFPFPGVSALKGEIADQTVQIAYESLQIARRTTLTLVRKTFWDLVYIRKARTVSRETLDLLQHLEGVAMTRYRTGKTSYQDLVKVRISRETIEEELATLKKRQRLVEARLMAILDLPGRPVLGPVRDARPALEVPPVADLVTTALDQRQEIKRLKARINKMERMVEMAETMVLPPLTLNLSLYADKPVLSAGTGAVQSGFATGISAQRGAGLPRKPWFGISEAYLKETRQTLRALEKTWLAERADTRYRTRRAWFELDRAVREARLLHESVLPLSQTALDVSTREYESGDLLFADLIVSFRQWFDARLMAARKHRDVGIAWAELVDVMGKDTAHHQPLSQTAAVKES